MTGTELREKINYVGMERAVRILAIKENLAKAEELAQMTLLDVCDLVCKEFDLVFAESEAIGLVKHENKEKLFKLLEVIER